MEVRLLSMAFCQPALGGTSSGATGAGAVVDHVSGLHLILFILRMNCVHGAMKILIIPKSYLV
jgi:hypothetical protein